MGSTSTKRVIDRLLLDGIISGPTIDRDDEMILTDGKFQGEFT